MGARSGRGAAAGGRLLCRRGSPFQMPASTPLMTPPPSRLDHQLGALVAGEHGHVHPRARHCSSVIKGGVG